MSKQKSKKILNINARDFPTILGINPYQSGYQLLESKVEGKYPFFGNKFTEHGNKYEKLAIKTFEKIIDTDIDIYQSNRKHNEYNWITGRFDGITETKVKNKKRKREDVPEENIEEENNERKKKKRKKNGIEENYENEKICEKKKKRKRVEEKLEENKIVEIKCPLKKDRQEPLTLDNIPKYYWAQCQVYMQMANLKNAFYVEYYIEPDAHQDSGKLYYLNISRDDEWWKNSLPKIKKFYEEMKKYCQLGSLDTHPIRMCENDWKKQYI